MKRTAALCVLIAAGLALAEGDKSDLRFDHEAHRTTKPASVTDENCGTCHGEDPLGKLSAVGAIGHQPCLQAGCHASAFVQSGSSTKKSDPDVYAKATRFCAVCHEGGAPENHQKATAVPARTNDTGDYHVEFNHYEHTQKGTCRSCHPMHTQAQRPAHKECGECHGDSAPPMNKCNMCHSTPSRAAYFKPRKQGSVRSCGTEAHLSLARKLGKPADKVPCFRHDIEGHRSSVSRGKKKALECGHCHYMISDATKWRTLKKRYSSLSDVKSNPVMDNARDQAHARCGDNKACHSAAVDDRRGTGKCTLCHDQKLVESLFGP